MLLRVEMEIMAANKMLERVGQKQLPFAFAYTLTLTAIDAQQEIIRQLPQRFTLRTGWWKPTTPLGFKFRKASKRWLEAEIYTRAYFMRHHEEGGIRRPKEAGSIAIPTTNIRKTKAQRITKANRPPALIRSAKRPAFFLPTRSGPVLFRRVTKRQLKALYTFERQVRIPARLGMQDTANEILRRNLHRNFEKAFIYAIKKAH